MEEAARNHDGGQEGEILLKSSPDRAGYDNVVAHDDRDTAVSVVTTGDLLEESNDRIKEKRHSMKQVVHVEALLEEEENEKKTSKKRKRKKINPVSAILGENSEPRDRNLHDGASMLGNTPATTDDDIVSTDKNTIRDITENIDTRAILHEEQTIRKKRKKPKKKAVSAEVNLVQNLDLKVENLTTHTHNTIIEHAAGNQLLEETLDEIPGTTSSADLLKLRKLNENEACANNDGSIFDVIADQHTKTPVGQISKRKKKKKNKKPTNSHTETIKKGVMLGNEKTEASSVRDKEIAISVEGIMSPADESTDMVIGNVSGNKTELKTDVESKEAQGIKGRACDICNVKPPQDNERDQNVQEELVVTDYLAQIIKSNQESQSTRDQSTAHDFHADQVVTASAVTVPVPDTEKPEKCLVSNVPQLDHNDKDGTDDANTSSIVNDTESKQSREENKVAPEEGIPLRTFVPQSIMDVCGPVSNGEAIHENKLLISSERNRGRPPSRKLVILDINGLLADIIANVPSGYKPDTTVSQKAVFVRPFCEDFLRFCFEKFDVGVWSSRVKKNVDRVLDFLMGDMKHKLVFYWDRYHCTLTGFSTAENRDKPLVLKELRKLWDDHQFHLGKYDQSNTLLLDDSPYKALCNPADTAIFPVSYQYTDSNDNSLGPGGNLRNYLERLAMSDNIPDFVRNNPFGQRPIRETNLSWKYYKKVLDSRSSRPKTNHGY